MGQPFRKLLERGPAFREEPVSERPHWYMATDGRGGYRPYASDMGPIEPHYINSLEKAVEALTRERDEAVRERDELRAAFREFPLVIKIVGNVTLHESVVWDGDFDSIDDAELRTVVMKFLKALPSTPLRIAFGDSLATDKSPETKDGEG